MPDFDLSEIKGLLARTQEMFDKMDNPDIEYQSPDKAFRSVTFLVDPMFYLGIEDLVHDYKDKPCFEIEHGVNLDRVVKHGHNANVPCASPHFCHLATFRPSPVHTPSFRKAFNNKWGYKE